MKKLLLGAALSLLAGNAWAVNPSTTLSNASYQVSITDCKLVTGSALTASRTLSLPYAGGTMIGQGYPGTGAIPCQMLEIWDPISAITSVNTLTIAPQSGDTINGVTSNFVVSQPGIHIYLSPLNGSTWYVGSDGGLYTTFITSTSGANSGVALTNATATNILSISNLSAGVWDCSTALALNPQATAVVSTFTVWISSTSATIPTAGLIDFQGQAKWAGPIAGVTNTGGIISGLELSAGPMRFSLTAPTTVYAEAASNFITAQESAYGMLTCRNVN